MPYIPFAPPFYFSSSNGQHRSLPFEAKMYMVFVIFAKCRFI